MHRSCIKVTWKEIEEWVFGGGLVQFSWIGCKIAEILAVTNKSRCPGSKIIDCGPVGPLMMDLSPSCWEGLSPSHFKEPERVIRRLEPLHCQWTKFITLQRAWSSSYWEGLSPSHFKEPERVIRRLEPFHCQWTKFITLQRAWSPSCWEGLSPSHFKGPERVINRLEPFHCQWTQVHDIAKGLKVAKGCWLIFLHKNIMI